ncbi:hypothetical protein L1987_26247 [Smallanthus sonchifolius]|uniref:Uncharacterized protein n=1 Tax=Smallanthus sonchifolius TaxID=185202 RepID=A0ACB9IAK4_9ASTR|nr:hypothetical protein L1987_26247 [Smallanthus sonchifolius]
MIVHRKKMERKQGFFSSLRHDLVRGLSPARSRAKIPGRTGSSVMELLQLKPKHVPVVGRTGSLNGEMLAPLIEGPDPAGDEIGESKRVGSGIGNCMKGNWGVKIFILHVRGCREGEETQLTNGNRIVSGDVGVTVLEFKGGAWQLGRRWKVLNAGLDWGLFGGGYLEIGIGGLMVVAVVVSGREENGLGFGRDAKIVILGTG